MTRLKIGGMVLAAALGAAACGDDDNGPTGPSNTGPIVFSSTLSAQNEVPPITNAESNARGTATITFNVPRDASGAPTGDGPATFAVQLTGFPANSAAILAHIHTGAPGINNPPLVNTNLSPAAPIVIGDGSASVTLTATVTRDQAAQIMANPNGYYFNVHTPVNTGGAVRGQLVRQQ